MNCQWPAPNISYEFLTSDRWSDGDGNRARGVGGGGGARMGGGESHRGNNDAVM